MIAPEPFRDHSINALRATGWMAVPVMAEVVARLIQNGGLARQAKLKRDKAAVRDGIARRLCLGAPATEADLERALVEIRRILQMAEAISFV